MGQSKTLPNGTEETDLPLQAQEAEDIGRSLFEDQESHGDASQGMLSGLPLRV